MKFGVSLNTVQWAPQPSSLHQRGPAVVVAAVHRGSLSQQEPDQVLMTAGRRELQGGVPLLVRAVHRYQRQHVRDVVAVRPSLWPQPALPSGLFRGSGLQDAPGGLIVPFVAGPEKEQRISGDTEIHLLIRSIDSLRPHSTPLSLNDDNGQLFFCHLAAACVWNSWRTVKWSQISKWGTTLDVFKRYALRRNTVTVQNFRDILTSFYKTTFWHRQPLPRFRYLFRNLTRSNTWTTQSTTSAFILQKKSQMIYANYLDCVI